MPTNIADEFGDIAKRMKSITGEEGRQEPIAAPTLYWCYRHGALIPEQTIHTGSYSYRQCAKSGGCARPVLRYCNDCDCSGWNGPKQCRTCGNPFDMKNPNE